MSVAGIPGFLENRRELFESADEENAQIKAFIGAWWDKHQRCPVTVKELLEIATDLPIEAKNDQGMRVKLGRLVRSLVGRRFTVASAVVCVRPGGASNGTPLWKLMSVESVDSVESTSVNAYARAREVEVADRDSTDSPDSTPALSDEPDWVRDDLFSGEK
jgi:hypothetical protein